MDLDKLSGLQTFLASRVIGQPTAVATLSKAVRAGEMGHTPKGMPKCFALVLGPTGTGKTKAVLEMSKYLFGTDQVARINMAEFGSAEGLGQFIPNLCDQLDQLLASKGKFLLLDEIEKGHPKASDIFLGMEAAMIQNPVSGKRYDLSDLHIFVTSNVGARDLSELDEGVPFPVVKRVVEDAAQSQFRPEVFARFTHVVIYNKLTRDAQVNICRQMLDEELSFQQDQLSRMFGHPHRITVGDGVFRRLLSEGYHRELGARPMRNVVNIRLRDALTSARLAGRISPGITGSRLDLAGDVVVLNSTFRMRGSALTV
jgi:ATP-dependent Clp protease ATP-binding subunit ClpA